MSPAATHSASTPGKTALSSVGPFLPILGASLFWWTASDRLDLPKLGLALGLALAVLILRMLRKEAWTFVWTSALIIALVFNPTGMGERIEVWALWLLWLVMVALGRGLAEDELAVWLARLALGLSAIAWLQAAGLPLFNSELSGFEGRRVVATLGGPGHLGWSLALLLPWLAHHARQRYAPVAAGALIAFVLGALVLSGARTAWIMAAVSLPLGLGWPGAKRILWLAGLALLGMGLAVGLDLLGDKARLGDRIEDLSEAGGTAQGRAYLWRVHWSAKSGALAPGLGYGPEGFQRRWPHWQNAYLKQHPEDARFRSDLRHAHADLVELACDLGPLALLGLLVLLGLAVWRKPSQGRLRGGPALGCLAAALLGGMTAPLLFFAPTAAIVGLSLGLRLGAARRMGPPGTRLLLLGLLGVGLFFLAQRGYSEVARSRASLLRSAGQLDLARVLVEQAIAIDQGNSRAWIERASICRAAGDAVCACQSVGQARARLPNDPLQRRHDACQAHGRWW